MIGDMIAKVRKEKGMTKTELAKRTGINIGHLTHIEKEERNPSHKALRNICHALDIPYQPLMYTYDKTLNEEQEEYKIVNHIAYNKILAVSNIDGFIDCPSEIPSSAIAIKMADDSMEPTILKDSYVYVEFNSPVDNKDVGLFLSNNEVRVRRYSLKKGTITLKSDNKSFNPVTIDLNDDFYIIGKILLAN